MDLLLKYFPKLSAEQVSKFTRLQELYEDWNSKINVISRKDIEFLYERHVLHSLGIAKFIDFKPGTKILDVGTGGGFPGIPLAILFPECRFTLVDSIGKKITVVQGVADSLGLKNIEALKIRAEELDEAFDFVVSRAVTEFNTFYSWTKTLFAEKDRNGMPNGIIYLKGGDLKEELKGFKHAEVMELSRYFSEEFFETKKLVYLPV